ncbi:Uncharacterized protein FKW44_011863 [Caligus rogercresseyi]|uniref:RNA-directed RNA polymerase n=1 Tax=Caligus rogercresseyi TaxID=217165 RepID=A0A7T8HII6_CALRO|nr:Uncharacterized protein FKW44_011863 [Caligus rogercresseyi]
MIGEGCLTDKIEQVLIRCFNQILAPKELAGDWEHFCKTRQEWIASGSSGGYKLEVRGQNLTVNKPVMFENVSSQEMLPWLYSTPVLMAKGSEKFELGKARAIYGTQPLDYTIMTYAIDRLERGLCQIDGIQTGRTGRSELIDVASRLRQTTLKNRCMSMIDYADFNIQHSLDVQSRVLSAIRRSSHYNWMPPTSSGLSSGVRKRS